MTTTEPTPTTPPRRRIAMWLALSGVVLAVVLAFVVGARAAALLLAAELLVCALVRAIAGTPGPYGIASRSKAFDVSFLLLGAAVMAVLAITADNV